MIQPPKPVLIRKFEANRINTLRSTRGTLRASAPASSASAIRGRGRKSAATSAVAFFAALFLPRLVIAEAEEAGAETRSAPLFDRSLLILFISNFLISTGFGGWITSYAPFATERLGWTTFEVGILFTIFAIGDITLGPWIGRLADRTGRKRVAVASGFPVALFGIALVLGFPRLLLYATAYLAGTGLTAFFSSWFALITIAVPAQRRGRVFGVVSALGNIGTVVGALGAAAIWQAADLGIALVLASFAALGASLVLILLPADRTPAVAAPATLAAAGS